MDTTLRRYKILFVVLALCLVVALGVWSARFVVFGVLFAGCPDRAALVEKLKALDPNYLAELAAFAASNPCAPNSACRSPLLDRLDGLGNRAPVFESFNGDAQIKLGVCMDEGVILIFTDIGTPRAAILVSTSADGIHWERTPLWSATNGGDGRKG